jgi:Uma2 family endonuclease
MTALRKEICYTIDDIYDLPDGERAELIDGKIYDMSSPSRTHQKIVSYVSRVIGNYIESNNGNCEVYPSNFAVFLYDDETTYLEPDIVVVCDTSKLDEKGCHGAPDWVVEVVSPSSRSMDYLTKLYHYKNAGVREYWVVDYEKNRVSVYDITSGEVEEYTLNDKVKVHIYEDLEIDFAKIGLN